MSAPRKYRITLFGATGFTGGLTAHYLARHLPADTVWALAGRDLAKLEAVRSTLPASQAQPPELLQADVYDSKSLEQLARNSQVIITTVGPYSLYGENLVRACAEHGTHYCDLTGEPEFNGKVFTRYHNRARETGAALLCSCGFDTVPADIGAYYTVREMESRLGGPIQHPLTMRGAASASADVSGGTWQSALTVMARPLENHNALKQAEEVLDQTYPSNAKLLPLIPGYSKDLQGFLAPLPTLDGFMIIRSARGLPDTYGPDFRYGHYTVSKNLPKLAAAAVGFSALFAAAQVPPLRKGLKKLRASGDGPSEEKRAKGWFKMRFHATCAEAEVVTEISGGEPFYNETSKILAEVGMGLAFEGPQQTGAITPVLALGDGLVERLQNAGILFNRIF